LRVIVYVEGPSDVAGLNVLFANLIRDKANAGTAIEFLPAARGDRKAWLLLEAPKRAANFLLNVPDSMVGIVPDLTPPNKGFPHTTEHEMTEVIRDRFDDVLRKKGEDDTRLQSRLGVFCFKYEFEVLLLAAEEQLRAHLGCAESACRWIRPPENQDHGNAPKDVVERLFRECGWSFQPILAATEILRDADYLRLKQACPQCFAPFAEWLESAGGPAQEHKESGS
jgi:hypothetical protein